MPIRMWTVAKIMNKVPNSILAQINNKKPLQTRKSLYTKDTKALSKPQLRKHGKRTKN